MTQLARITRSLAVAGMGLALAAAAPSPRAVGDHGDAKPHSTTAAPAPEPALRDPSSSRRPVVRWRSCPSSTPRRSS